MQHILRFTFTLCLSLMLLSTASMAAENAKPAMTNEEQPIHITADRLQANEKAGKSLYSGKVVVTQGTLTLKGETIKVSHPNGQLTTIIALGKPAKFKRFNETEQAWLMGQAQKIAYRAQEKTLLLIGNARVEQPGKHVITGPELFYDITKKTLQAQSTATENKRISVTLNPGSNKESITNPSSK